MDEDYIKIINYAKNFLLTTTHHWANLYIEENLYEGAIEMLDITDIIQKMM